MLTLLDTNILIYVADGVGNARARFAALSLGQIAMSTLTAAELEASIHTDPVEAQAREVRTRPLLLHVAQAPFSAEAAARYGQIVRAQGYSRRKAIDRMIGAQALAMGAKLITANPADFADIEGLMLEPWDIAVERVMGIEPT
jgi:tRNA(fMet)-specific endonuclease VapC